MAEPHPAALLEAAANRVRDPVSGKSVWAASMIDNARWKGSDLVYDLRFDHMHDIRSRQSIPEEIEKNLRDLGFSAKVYAMPAGAPPQMPGPDHSRAPGAPRQGPPPGMERKPLFGVQHVVAVSSGKGGVGKSTVSVNLAVALAKLGYEVGLLDADIYGPSAHTMLGTDQRPAVEPRTNRILPPIAHGVRLLTMGTLVDQEEAMIWRGPMVMTAVQQFLNDASWSGTDYLIIDLPPGTGDAQLTLIQSVQISGAVIVTTPQEVALADTVRGVTMFQRLEVPLLGVVENMAWYELPDGTRDPVFGEGGGKKLAETIGTDLLAQIPLQSSLRAAGDEGQPPALSDAGIGAAFRELARRVAEKIPITD